MAALEEESEGLRGRVKELLATAQVGGLQGGGMMMLDRDVLSKQYNAADRGVDFRILDSFSAKVMEGTHAEAMEENALLRAVLRGLRDDLDDIRELLLALGYLSHEEQDATRAGERLTDRDAALELPVRTLYMMYTVYSMCECTLCVHI